MARYRVHIYLGNKNGRLWEDLELDAANFEELMERSEEAFIAYVKSKMDIRSWSRLDDKDHWDDDGEEEE